MGPSRISRMSHTSQLPPPYASLPANALPDLAIPCTASPPTYLQSHTTSTAIPLNNSTNLPHPPPYFRSHILRDRLPSQQRALPSQQSQPFSRYPISNAIEARYQQQRQNSHYGVTTDLRPMNSELVSAAPSLSSALAGSATSSTWVCRRTEELLGVRSMIPTSDLPGDQGTSPVVHYPPTFSDPFSDTNPDVRATPSGFVSTPPHTAQEYSVSKTSSENVQYAREHVQRMADSWKEDAKGVLILSGVLSAIVTAFLIESYKMLPPGSLGDGPSSPPAASIVWVNIMWLMSLVLSITSTLFATLALHWARRFTERHRILNTSRDHTYIRSFMGRVTPRYDVHYAVSMIVMFLHLSLFLFLVGLVVFFFTINKLVAIIFSMVVGLFGMIYLIITILGNIDRDCPYHTPMSGAWWSQREQLGYT